MSDIKVLTCQSCGTPLSREEEYKPNWFECSACSSLNYFPVTASTEKLEKYVEPDLKTKLKLIKNEECALDGKPKYYTDV